MVLEPPNLDAFQVRRCLDLPLLLLVQERCQPPRAAGSSEYPAFRRGHWGRGALPNGTQTDIICSTQTMVSTNMSEPGPSSRLTNLVATFALAATDDMLSAIEARSAMIAGAPAALVSILIRPGESLDTLRKVLRLTPSGAGRLIDRLAAAGLVERRAGESDQRFIALYLTRRGHAVAERVLAARRAALQTPLVALSPREQAMLETVLEKMLYAMTPDQERCNHICRLCEITACPHEICPVGTAARAKKAGGA
jgi:MarR family transcriptional regulator, negative regulator of the multidrug operon emrRAB